MTRDWIRNLTSRRDFPNGSLIEEALGARVPREVREFLLARSARRWALPCHARSRALDSFRKGHRLHPLPLPEGSSPCEE